MRVVAVYHQQFLQLQELFGSVMRASTIMAYV